MGFSFLVLGKASQAEVEILYVEKIKLLLEFKCGDCHGDTGKKIRGDYDMRSRAGLLKGGESGDPSLIPCANIRVGGERRGLWIFASMVSTGGRSVGWSRPCRDVGRLRS